VKKTNTFKAAFRFGIAYLVALRQDGTFVYQLRKVEIDEELLKAIASDFFDYAAKYEGKSAKKHYKKPFALYCFHVGWEQHSFSGLWHLRLRLSKSA
jgi:hypothetical protein